MPTIPTTVRNPGYSRKGWLAVFTGSLVLTATLSADPTYSTSTNANSAKSLSITISVGNIANVKRGYRVVLESAGGAAKGVTSVRYGGTLDATHLPIREWSEGEHLLVAGDVVKVYSIPVLTDKLVEDTDDFNPDGVPVGTYNSDPPPLTCSGGLCVKRITSGSSVTMQMTGSTSLNIDPDASTTTPTHLWTLPTGVTFHAGSLNSDADPLLDVTQGEYIVTHTCTDPDNGQTWTQYVPIKAYDSTHLPYRVIMETTPEGDPERGWSCAFRIPATTLTQADLPDGALVAFFVDETSAGQVIDDRSHIKFVGYVTHDETELTPQQRIVRFSAVSPLERLGQMAGFSKLMISSTVYDEWSKLKALSLVRAIVQMRFYTSAFDGAHDLLLWNADTGLGPADFIVDRLYPILTIDKKTAVEQIRDMAGSLDAVFTCDRSGHFNLYIDPPLLATATRASLDTAYTFTERDVLHLTARRDPIDVLEMVEVRGLSATASTNPEDSEPVFSRYPGAPMRGSQYTTVERGIFGTASLAAQDDANARSGRRGAQLNRTYVSPSTGLTVRAPEIEAEFRLPYDCFDFYPQIYRFTNGVFTNPRNLDLSALDYVLTKVTTSFERGTGRVVATFQAMTDAPLGSTYIPPETDVASYVPPDYVPLPFVPPPLRIPPETGQSPTRFVMLSADEAKCVLITAVDWQDTDPATIGTITESDRSTGLTGTYGIWGHSNPFNYKTFYASTDTGLHVMTDIVAGGSFSLLASNLTMFGNATYLAHKHGGSINRSGFVWAINGYNVYAYSFDGGATWTTTTPVGAANGSTSYFGDAFMDVCFVERSAGHAYALLQSGGSDPTWLDLYKTTDYGASWTLAQSHFSAHSGAKRLWLEIPYTRRDDTPNVDDADCELLFYAAGDVHTGGTNDVYCYTSGPADTLYTGTSHQQSGSKDIHPLASYTHSASVGAWFDGLYPVLTDDDYSTTPGYGTSGGSFDGSYAGGNVNGWSPAREVWIHWARGNGSPGCAVHITRNNGASWTRLSRPAGWSGGGVAYIEGSLSTVQ